MENNRKIFESIESDENILFYTVRVYLDLYEDYNLNEYIRPGICKVVLNISDKTCKVHYFKNGIETSKEKILQENRLEELKR